MVTGFVVVGFFHHICSNRKYQLTACRVEDSDHFFMSCKYLDMFWNKINELLKEIKFENNIRLQHLVFGYNIFDKEYFHLDYLSCFDYPGKYSKL
jgi:hypothetical protein